MQKKGHPYGGIRRTILTAMIFVPFVPFILITGLSFYSLQSSLENGTIARMHRIVEDHRQMIENFLLERSRDIEFIINAYTVFELVEPQKLNAVFEHLKKTSPAFKDLGIFDAKGVHVAYQGPYQLAGRHYQDAAWFIEVMKSGFYISDVFMGYRQEPHFIIAMANGSGADRWVLRTTIDTQTFELLVNAIRIGKTGEAYIVNNAGVLQTTRRSGGNLLSKVEDTPPFALGSKAVGTFLSENDAGNKYLFAMAHLKGGAWTLVVRQKASEAFSVLYATVIQAVIISILGGAAIVAIAFYVTDRIVRQMEKIDSEKESLSRQLIGTSRLAELGEMAAGFAHEINNPLQIIQSEQSLIETLLDEIKVEGRIQHSDRLAELEDALDQIKLQISRCAKITQAILRFGRQAEPEAVEIDLHDFVPEVTKMIQQRASVHGISFDQRIDPKVMTVRGDPAQLQQVLLNLLNNAIDAILFRHGVSGGELTVKAMPSEDGQVEIQVTDNGVGISSANLNKVFAPFFTTKPVGEGTGLGLSVCFGIVESMGGHMEVVSQAGQGTTFAVKLPQAA